MTILLVQSPQIPLSITWEKLPPDFVLPDEPVESNLQPLLAAALRESLELAGLILESVIIATNFGICATVDRKTVVKAPDWVYVPTVKPFPDGEIRRSYTPCTEGDLPSIVMEFISATDGGEYSFNPHYPYGKWYFYEQILKVPTYVIFHPQLRVLEVYHLVDGKYQLAVPDEDRRFWIESLGLFLGAWVGKKADYEGCWLRWWDASGNLILWGGELLELERQQVAAERQQAEVERQQAEVERQLAEVERQRAEAERQRAEAEHQRAEVERQRAEAERQRAEAEHQQAEVERQRAEAEHQRAEQAEEKNIRLAERLRAMGVDPEQI